ncbi:MAG: hypothetical protein HOD92_00930 [Deltaproteobacteria bacterium]|jgi:hypothetical protein|nr:hypothetical protein [Deltaproteobacteria bacterium]
MKQAILILIFSFFSSLIYAEFGSFFILKSVYLYKDAELKTGKTLTRRQKAYDVVQVKFDSKKNLLFQITVPEKTNLVNGSGYITETETELEKSEQQYIKVYSRLPKLQTGQNEFVMVPKDQLLFTGRQEKSESYPFLDWREVNYKTDLPMSLWVADWAGVYRPDKDAEWLNSINQKFTIERFSKKMKEKILFGIIEVGFSSKHVSLALGRPEKIIETEEKDTVEWIYPNRKIILNKNKVIRVL